jgi:hypothetical protein
VQARGAADQENGGARDTLHGREKLADLPHTADAAPPWNPLPGACSFS